MDVDELHERYLDKRVKTPGLFFFGALPPGGQA
jgi:hypothetical protein